MTVLNRTIIAEFIGEICHLLDEESFSDFLSRCSEEFDYQVTTYSPDLGKDMVWLEHDCEAFQMMLKMIPEHVRVDAKLSRHVTLSSIVKTSETGWLVRSKVAVFQTDPNGTTSILAVGTYADVVEEGTDGEPKLRKRELRLDTRDLGPGVHIPI